MRSWFRRAVREHEFLISEVADYELRRELLRIDSRRSLARLDELARELRFVSGEGLDGDLLIAAQAQGEAAAVVTFNEKHFESLADALSWTAVPLAET